MENQKLWTYLGVALAVGIAIQALKGPLFGNHQIPGLRVAGLLDEGQAVYVPGGAADASPFSKHAPRVPDVRVLAPHMSPAAKPTPAPAKKEDPKKKAEEAKKKAEADKKKKADDLKKKKALARKKAKEDIARRQAEADALKASDDKKKGNSDSGNGSDLSGTGGAIGGTATATAAAKTLPQTAAEWEAYLMNAPSVDHLETFIKSYQTGLVTSDIFYQVISAMLADPRIEVQTQAVSALGATPSASSFGALIAIDKNTSFPSKIVTLARAYERQYQRLENLKYLTATLGLTDSSNQPAAYVAITMISTAAQTYLATTSTTSTTDATSTTTAATTAATAAATSAKTKAAAYFKPVLVGLKTAESWPDVNVASSALATYKQISALMPTTTSTTTATTTASATTGTTATTTP